MFGYVLANRQALSEAELARYRGCYCGLCHAIGRAYGQPQRFALSYDLTFLVLLLSSLYEPPETQAQRRCLAHPLRRHGQWQSEFTGYAAAMNVALAYYQRLDDWTDDHAPLAWAESRTITPRWPGPRAGCFRAAFQPSKRPIPGSSRPSRTRWTSFGRWSSRTSRSRTSLPPPSEP